MDIKEIVLKMHNNTIKEFIVVYVQKEESIHPYGTFGWDSSDKYGIVLLSEYNRFLKGECRLPYVHIVREKDVFKTKEELMKSLT